MRLIGVEVFHKKYGYGKITNVISDKVDITFYESNEVKKFLYPDSFEEYLKIKSNSINKEIKKEKEKKIFKKNKAIDDNRSINLIPKSKFFTVYTYKRRNICTIKNHNRNSVTAIVQSVKTKDNYEIDINYCVTCEKYYINEISLNEYEERYGVLLLKRIPEESVVKLSNDIEWRDKSELTLFGYSVKEGSLSSQERVILLNEILRTKAMKKNEIKDWLEYLISSRQKQAKFQKAVIKWKEDLNFVNNYNSKNERKIVGNLERNIRR